MDRDTTQEARAYNARAMISLVIIGVYGLLRLPLEECVFLLAILAVVLLYDWSDGAYD